MKTKISTQLEEEEEELRNFFDECIDFDHSSEITTQEFFKALNLYMGKKVNQNLCFKKFKERRIFMKSGKIKGIRLL